jgi:hypothetical protein
LLLAGALCEAGMYSAKAPRPRAAMRTVAAQTDAMLDALLGHDGSSARSA